ncbi:hypothetical protein DFA_11513 [Cavenderia fasciculata]|uniref:diaminopimelate epimerase n=1 Tax=Cavenderia fasciculata TaxID=261658 RepID=F4QDC4_CACFS|nr:uncharacterized protein DFA_11513 [Cavenderia fasciculata]EGG13752.1 hypothetical protein DFA_11513 [Cavenderia fasciculata]|eukprot:XP_004350460.1 hypothetical protein DFA_11513 [Cavenderia fasciculata]
MIHSNEITFTKMQGAGNDFIVFKKEDIKVIPNKQFSPDSSEGVRSGASLTIEDLSVISKKLAHRKLGIGCDQLIIVADSPNADTDYEMLIFNSDGSQASMCGNGIRCFSKYIIDNSVKSIHDKDNKNNGSSGSGGSSDDGESSSNESENAIVHRVHTLAGTIICSTDKSQIGSKNNGDSYYREDTMLVKVNMGNPYLLRTNDNTLLVPNDRTILVPTPNPSTDKPIYLERVQVDERRAIDVVLVSMGNPHCVIFLQDNIEKGQLPEGTDIDTMDISEIGQKLAKHKMFVDSCNIEFVSSTKANHFKARVWERGAGETLACGTGACAVAVATVLVGKSLPEQQISINMPGGELLIDWNANENFGKVFKTGPATSVFSSVIKI